MASFKSSAEPGFVNSSSAQLSAKLEQVAETLELSLLPSQRKQLLEYLRLLERWNKSYNLTAARSVDRMLAQHLADCLTLVRPIERQLTAPEVVRILDAGSGAGLPGVVLAVMLPNVHVTCVDSVQKKTAFVRQVSAELHLSNLKAVHARLEAPSDHRYDLIVSRALASLNLFCRLTGHSLAQDGTLLAMKGKRPDEEIDELDAAWEVFHVEHPQVPFLDVERSLIWIRRNPAHEHRAAIPAPRLNAPYR